MLNAGCTIHPPRGGVNVILDTPIERTITVDFEKKGFTRGMRLVLDALGASEFTGQFELGERFTGSTYRIHKLSAQELDAKRSRAVELNARGEALLDEGKDYQAMGLFGAAIREDPEMSLPYKNAAQVFEIWGDHAKRAEALEKVVEAEPEKPENYRLLGDAYWGDFRYEEAAAAYGKALESVTTAPGARAASPLNARINAATKLEPYQTISRARELLAERRIPEAVTVLDDAIDSIEPHPELYVFVARAYEMAGNYEQAISWRKRYAEQFPEDVPNLFALVRELQMMSRHQESAAYLSDAQEFIRSEFLSKVLEELTAR